MSRESQMAEEDEPRPTLYCEMKDFTPALRPTGSLNPICEASWTARASVRTSFPISRTNTADRIAFRSSS